MRPVNLLPASERPRKAVKAPANASAIVLGCLALLVLVMGMFVLTKNSITDRRAEIAEAKQRTNDAKARASTLKSFADFRQVKQTREASVTQLATQRFDWERFLRELSLVLPDKVWLNDLSGTTGTAEAGAAGGTSAAPVQGTAATTASSTPSVKLSGCAPSHKAVATTLVRLRSIHAVDDVDLQDSTSAKAGDASGGASASSDSGSAGGSGSAVCSGFKFDATVTFSSQSAQSSAPKKRVPQRLGGGA